MADITRQALESGAFADGEHRLADRLATTPGDDEARIGLGVIRFAEAIERFGQAQYRYGLKTGLIGLPVIAATGRIVPRLLPDNPTPQPLSYEQQRTNLQALLDDLAQVETTLAPMGETKAKITLDLDRFQFHFTGAGPADPKQTLGAIRAQLTSRPAFGATPGSPTPSAEPFEATFDRADALWLRVYAHMLSAGISSSRSPTIGATVSTNMPAFSIRERETPSHMTEANSAPAAAECWRRQRSKRKSPT